MTSQETTELAGRPEPNPARLHLSAIQILASALAACSATVAASFFGVTGTVVGAALASVITVVGNAVYGHTMRRTSERVKAVVPVAYRWNHAESASGQTTHAEMAPSTTGQPGSPEGYSAALPHRRVAGGLPWKKLTVGIVGVFAAICVLLSGIELVTGKPLADLLTGKHGSGTSVTTVFGSGGQHGAGRSTPTPSQSTKGSTPSTSSASASTSTPSTTPASSASPSTSTTTVTTTATPSASATASTPTSSSESPQAASSARVSSSAAPVP